MKYEIFVIHIATISINSGYIVYLLSQPKIVYLKVNSSSIKVSNKYTDFADIFLLKLAAKLLKYMRINDDAIELVENCQFFYGLFYNLDPID